MPHRLASKLILALALIVLIVKTFAMYINVTSQEARLLESMTLGADQLSRSITSATWQMMLADRRDAAYSVMHTIALKQGIDRIRMFNKDGELMFSTVPEERILVDKRAEVCNPCHSSSKPLVKVDVPNRARTFRDSDGRRKMAMITPIYNEPSCSNAPCHAHPASVSVLGVLDLGINLSRVDQEIASIRARTLGLGLVEVVLIGVFIVFFTRHFVETPIQQADRRHQGDQRHEARPADHDPLERGARGTVALAQRHARAPAGGDGGEGAVHPAPGEQGRGAHGPAQDRAAEADPGRPARLAGPARGERRARDQQPGFRRPQPRDADAAHPQGRRHPTRPRRGVPPLPRPGRHRDHARRAHRLRPALVLAPFQAPERRGRPQRDRHEHGVPRLPQARARRRRGGPRPDRGASEHPLRRLADPAGRHEPGAQRRRSDQGGRPSDRPDADRSRRRRGSCSR